MGRRDRIARVILCPFAFRRTANGLAASEPNEERTEYFIVRFGTFDLSHIYLRFLGHFFLFSFLIIHIFCQHRS